MVGGEMMGIPEYLYHYTSIDSLIMILVSKKLRLNTLLNMDDADEIITKNSPFLGKYCYISSWTASQEENIPLWSMYTGGMTGVRLKMRSLPFEKRKVSLGYYDEGKPFSTYYPDDIIHSNHCNIIPTIPFLREVEYTYDENLIFPEPITYLQQKSNGLFDLQGNFDDICRWKRGNWKFQEEWRYCIFVLPHDTKGRLVLNLAPSTTDMTFTFYDLKFCENAFDDIEIMMGPKFPDKDKALLEKVCERYAPKAALIKSSLNIR